MILVINYKSRGLIYFYSSHSLNTNSVSIWANTISGSSCRVLNTLISGEFTYSEIKLHKLFWSSYVWMPSQPLQIVSKVANRDCWLKKISKTLSQFSELIFTWLNSWSTHKISKYEILNHREMTSCISVIGRGYILERSYLFLQTEIHIIKILNNKERIVICFLTIIEFQKEPPLCCQHPRHGWPVQPVFQLFPTDRQPIKEPAE